MNAGMNLATGSTLKTLDLNKPFENIAEQLNEIGDRMMSGLFVHFQRRLGTGIA